MGTNKSKTADEWFRSFLFIRVDSCDSWTLPEFLHADFGDSGFGFPAVRQRQLLCFPLVHKICPATNSSVLSCSCLSSPPPPQTRPQWWKNPKPWPINGRPV